MKQLKTLTAKSDKELMDLISDSRQQLATLAIDMRTKQVPGVKQIAAHKRTIARCLTLLREREISKLELSS